MKESTPWRVVLGGLKPEECPKAMAGIYADCNEVVKPLLLIRAA